MATALTLLSGAVMVLAGYLGQTESWTLAAFITIPGGVLILAASALARRADRPSLLTATPRRSRRMGAGVTVGRLVSGGTMVLAGYALAAWGMTAAALLASVGGLVVGVAFAVERRGMRAANATSAIAIANPRRPPTT